MAVNNALGDGKAQPGAFCAPTHHGHEQGFSDIGRYARYSTALPRKTFRVACVKRSCLKMARPFSSMAVRANHSNRR